MRASLSAGEVDSANCSILPTPLDCEAASARQAGSGGSAPLSGKDPVVRDLHVNGRDLTGKHGDLNIVWSSPGEGEKEKKKEGGDLPSKAPSSA
jgi:hypothetical protein